MRTTTRTPSSPPARRPLPLVALATLTLLIAGWAGLVRSGWPWPSPGEGAIAQHGALMVSGFVGALVAFERAIVLRALGQSRERWGGLLSGIAVLVFVANTVRAARARRPLP